MQSIEKPRNYATGVVIAVLAILSVLGAFLWVLVSRNVSQPPAHAPQAAIAPKEEKKEPAKQLEYRLAVINAGGSVLESDVTVTRFRYLLDDLQKKTGYTEQQIADMNTFAVDTLRDKYGRNFKLLDFMEQSRKQLRLNGKMNYKEVVAAIIAVAGSDQN